MDPELLAALNRRDLGAVVECLADRFALPADVACPACRGCYPGDGPDERVCRCGTTGWEVAS